MKTITLKRAYISMLSCCQILASFLAEVFSSHLIQNDSDKTYTMHSVHPLDLLEKFSSYFFFHFDYSNQFYSRETMHFVLIQLKYRYVFGPLKGHLLYHYDKYIAI